MQLNGHSTTVLEHEQLPAAHRPLALKTRRCFVSLQIVAGAAPLDLGPVGHVGPHPRGEVWVRRGERYVLAEGQQPTQPPSLINTALLKTTGVTKASEARVEIRVGIVRVFGDRRVFVVKLGG